MQIEKYTPSLSRNALLVMLLTFVVVSIVIVLNLNFLKNVYFSNQLTRTGIFVNGLIVLMFVLGIGKIILNLLFYRQQEIAISHFLENDIINPDMAMANIDETTLVAQRYQTMQSMRRASAPIDQGALAAILVATESARSSLPKFVNNILILTGVFGTIVSLSIALIGASDLLQTAESLGGMNLVVHGMSTALSTTITAIVCFMFFGYFHVRTTDIQTHVISVLERVTLERLMPRFNVTQAGAMGDVGALVTALQNVGESLQAVKPAVSGNVPDELIASVAHQEQQLALMNQQLQEMLKTLRVGFRLDH
ncbi:MAG: hypothetical protein AAF434_11910 [Pseudomonadota bacterium]